MRKRDLREPIVRQVLVLLFVLFLAMTALFMNQNYMRYRINFIHLLAKNEQVKVELSYLVHEKLQAIRNYFHKMALINNADALQFYTRKINEEIKGLEDFLLVIENGGAVTYLYKVNFGKTGQIAREFLYQNYHKNRIALDVIEIRAKLIEIQDYITELLEVLTDASLQSSPKLKKGDRSPGRYSDQLVSIYKRLDPFFERLLENSYRIYFDADSEMQQLQKIGTDVVKTFQKRLVAAYVVVGGIIFVIGFIVLRNIELILMDRRKDQAALRLSNEMLENTVSERTKELQKEVDIRLQAETEQRKQAEFLRTMIDSLDHPFYVVDVKTYGIQIMNEAASKLGPDNTSFCYGLTHKRTEPCTGAEHPCPISEIKRTGKPTIMEHVHYDNNNQKIYVEVHGYPIFNENGELSQIIEYSLDITKRKHAEMALEQASKKLVKMLRKRTRRLGEEVANREKLLLVVEQNPSSIIITDLEGNIEYVNKMFEKVTGYTREEVLGGNSKMLHIGLTPSTTYVDMWNTIGQGKIWNGEFINKSKNNEIYHENVLVAPLKDEKGVITNYVIIKENITELKKAKEAAEASSQAKSQFLSRMSHELRTPLNAINGFSQLLLTDKMRSLDARQAEQVSQINAAGQHLLELINEILDLSRIESGKLSLSLEPIVIADAVAQCILLTSSLAGDLKISISMDSGIQELPAVKADLTRFRQVMLNLLSNAIKYNNPGGTVFLSGRMEGDMVCLEVADNGVGISEEKLKDLFVPFTRLGQDDTEIEGTGIGMTITRYLVELMGGTLDVKSEVGAGSVFSVRLPVVAEHMGGEEQPVSTILFIENNPDNIQIMRDIVGQWPDFSLIVRKNVVKGVKAVSMLQPDLILLNLDLVEGEGREIVSEITGNHEMSTVPIIALGSDDSSMSKQECLESGFTSFLTSPIEIDNLNIVIEECL